jgi:hypothetical protein
MACIEMTILTNATKKTVMAGSPKWKSHSRQAGEAAKRSEAQIEKTNKPCARWETHHKHLAISPITAKNTHARMKGNTHQRTHAHM